MEEVSHKHLYIAGAIVLVVVIASVFYVKKINSPARVELKNIKSFLSVTHDCNIALPRLEEFVQSNPDSSDGWYQLGLCQIKLGKAKLAVTSFETAVSLNSFSPAKDELEKYKPVVEALENKPTTTTTQSVGQNPPTGFPQQLVIKPLLVIESYTTSSPGGSGFQTSPQQRMFFKYSTLQTQTSLSSAFSAYLKGAGYTTRTQVIGEGTIVSANAKDKGCTISIGPNTAVKGKSTTERVVGAVCWVSVGQ